ncbi:NADH-quinone oxidoreductase subunit C [Streptomyces sp. NBC_00623]|uniref:NADH-quinone oxidoreductase subunit C n=1 Tax=Streptomyces sp. NBC_00623 TaxID=2975790 RepID=UPI0030E17384
MTSTPATDAYDSLPDAVTEIFGEDATAEHAYDLLTVDVPATAWIAALETARDRLGCTYFDWLSAVDEPGTGFRVCAHVAAPAHGKVRRLLIRTTVPHDAAALPTAVGVYSGAAWHERETHEMFGIGFEGHPHLVPLLLPDGFEGHPLRKDFVLAARVAKAWPGAKEPGESEHGGPKRRTMLPPGVPDPNEWGPLKGQLPPAPTRPARTARAAGDRPVRRARSVSEGSASQQPEAAAPAASTETAPPPPTPTPRRTRSASQGSASQQGETAAPEPAATEPTSAPAESAPAESASAESASAESAPAPRSTDAPWHNARPAFDETAEEGSSQTVGKTEEPGASQPLRQPRSGSPGAEPPVREGAGRGEAPRSDPAADTTDTSDEPAPSAQPGTPDQPDTADRPGTPDQPDTPNPDPASEPTPNPPAGGDSA